ncbi:hypothetical protein Hanom_Chr06g00544771 [Helianthus anomalus]
MQKGKGENDSNCWTSPSGAGFKIHGKMYLKDSAKGIHRVQSYRLFAVEI